MNNNLDIIFNGTEINNYLSNKIDTHIELSLFLSNNIDKEKIDSFLNSISDLYNFCSKSKVDLMATCSYSMKLNFPSDKCSLEDFIGSYLILIRYIKEYSYTYPDNSLSGEISILIDQFEEQRDFFLHLKNKSHCYTQYFYIKNIFDRKIAEYHTSKLNSDISTTNTLFKEFNESYSEFDLKYSRISTMVEYKDNVIEHKHQEFIEQVENDISARMNRLKELKETIIKLTSEYNFAALKQGYANLARQKIREKNMAIFCMLIFGSMAIMAASIKLLNLLDFLPVKIVFPEKEEKVIFYISIIGLTILFLYFFRISMINFNNIRTELNQISLRVNLCMFIESYIDFKKDQEDKELMNKFENIVFSNISSSNKNNISAFDDLDKLVKLIQAVNPQK
ncbi:hypothetical protein [Morganella morganii]|uniref:hypothetical protein n=1 Tax=Morganella morganii TaxID=582 RepID=UPI003EBBE77F